MKAKLDAEDFTADCCAIITLPNVGQKITLTGLGKFDGEFSVTAVHPHFFGLARTGATISIRKPSGE
jgi:hypothetical protein